jgi:hypothetical protein
MHILHQPPIKKTRNDLGWRGKAAGKKDSKKVEEDVPTEKQKYFSLEDVVKYMVSA